MGRIFNKKEITKEDFYKLNQLDRIEYRQRLDFIDREHTNTNPGGFMDAILLIIGFVFLVALGMYNIQPEAMASVLNLIPLIFQVGLGVFIVLVLLDFIFKYITSKKKRELVNEYFPLKLEHKGEKNDKKK
jgi:uncharacterized membrane-anchored protein